MSKEIVIDQLRENEKKTNRQIFLYLFFILINKTKDFLIKKKLLCQEYNFRVTYIYKVF